MMKETSVWKNSGKFFKKGIVMKELHIFNGDYALELWKNSNFDSENLVWRETYLEGPLPATDDLHQFRKARADFLPALAGLSAGQLYQHLQKLDDTILDFPANAVLMLWFDSCIFDQTLLMRILYLLNRRKNQPENVFLYCCNSNCLTPEDFLNGEKAKIKLLPQDFSAGEKAWRVFVSRNASAMCNIAKSENFERLPAMQKALIRCADEVPNTAGLNRTQRQILQIAEQGEYSFEEIFKKLDDFEEYPFLGDTACLRLLDDLQNRGFLKMTPGKRYQLSASSRQKKTKII